MMIGKLGMENASNLNGVLFVIPTKPNSQCDGRLAMRTSMRTSTIGLIFLIIVLGVTGQAFADWMIAPTLPHYLFNEIPFDWSDVRYQQVFDSSMFPSPMYITSLAFSPMTSGTYSADIDIRLGYTKAEPGALSTDLDSNVLGHLTTVFSDPSFSESFTGGIFVFDLVFDFSSSPFLLTPGKNLLLDIVIGNESGGVACSRFDYTISGFSSRAWYANGVGNADDAGLRTLIEFTPVSKVPEPSTMLLVGSRLIGLAGYGRKKFFKK